MSPDGSFLVFPEPIQCLRGGNVILTSILVSEDRMRVCDLIISSLCRNNNKILVTGTPGIGKYIYFNDRYYIIDTGYYYYINDISILNINNDSKIYLLNDLL